MDSASRFEWYDDLEILEKAIVDLLLSLGPRFSDYRPLEWSDAEQRAISHLLRAGLIHVEYVIVVTEVETGRTANVIGRLEGGSAKSEQMMGEVLCAIGWYPRNGRIKKAVHMDAQVSRLRLSEQGQIAASDLRSGSTYAITWTLNPHHNSPRLFVMHSNEGEGSAVHMPLAVGPAAIATARAEASIGDVIVNVNLPSAATPLGFTERESVSDVAQPPSVARERYWQSLNEIQLQLRNLAASDISILIIGETGTGKEYLAKNIHERSRRSDKPFQAINCATLTSERISAELFGYRKGAFTGADRDEPGLLRRADGGTVLLDELGDLPADCWGSLLRFLQEGEIHPLGCPTERVDVRVLAATNKPERLPKDVQYRFDHQVEVPPLRSRRNEIAALANSFFEDAKKEFSRTSLRFGTDERNRLGSDSYDWPGNVRQLKAAVRKAVLLHGAGRDTLADEILAQARQLDSLAE